MAAPNHQSKLPILQASTDSLIERPKSPVQPQAKTYPPSKIPSRPKTPKSSQQSRVGWRPPWKTPGKVDGGPQHPVYQSAAPESPSKPWYARAFAPSSIPKKSDITQAPAVSSSERSLPEPGQPEPLQRVMEASWWGETGIPLADIMRYQNPTVDRLPARVGEPCGSKLIVKLFNPYGRVIHPSSDPECKKLFEFPYEMDWFDHDQVRLLNRWRKAIFDHYFGPATEAKEVISHPLEDAFVLGKYDALERAAEAKRFEAGRELPSWARIARDYNATFEDKRLEGDGRPRPRMTRKMLRRRYLVPRDDTEVEVVPGPTNEEFAKSASSTPEQAHPEPS